MEIPAVWTQRVETLFLKLTPFENLLAPIPVRIPRWAPTWSHKFFVRRALRTRGRFHRTMSLDETAIVQITMPRFKF